MPFDPKRLEAEKTRGKRKPGGFDPQRLAAAKTAPGLVDRFKMGLGQQPYYRPGEWDIGDPVQFVGENILPAAAGMVGMKGGPITAAAAAAAGRMAQKVIAQRLGVGRRETALEAAEDATLTGVGQAAAGSLLATGGTIASQYVRPAASRIGAQLLRAGPAIPEKYGQAALQDVSLLSRAPTREAAGQLYERTITAAGLRSPAAVRAEAGQLIQSSSGHGDFDASHLVNSVYRKLITNDPSLTPQEALNAAQAARYLKDQARYGNPNELANLVNINRAKTAIDDWLEPRVPGYREARQAYREAKTAEQFDSWLPLNKNMSPNALRVWGSVGAATTAAGLSGSPLPLLAPLAISPKLAGLGIRAAYRLGQGARATAPLAQAETGSALAGAYDRLRGRLQSSPAR